MKLDTLLLPAQLTITGHTVVRIARNDKRGAKRTLITLP